MSHRSRLSTFVLDCQADDLAPHVEFWSRALGKRVDTLDEDGNGKYARLHTEHDEPILRLQKVSHAPRIHLDIEADDVDAEVERLIALGARKIEKVHTWVVMEAPSGHRFCVVLPQRKPFGPHANDWPGTFPARACKPAIPAECLQTRHLQTRHPREGGDPASLPLISTALESLEPRLRGDDAMGNVALHAFVPKTP